MSPAIPVISYESGLRGGRAEQTIHQTIMIFSASGRQFATMTPIALACAAAVTFSLCTTAQAQSPAGQTLAPVVVSGARFPNDPAFSPVGATIITADDIRSAGVDNVNEAIRKIGGVYGRQSLAGPNDFPLDLRGFGGFGDQNMVIFLDGIRISEDEQATPLLSSIPIDTIERIEIVRGGSSVLYGGGATGGTIQIITKRPQAGSVHGTVVGEAGAYGFRGGRASVSKSWDGFALNAAYSKERADNYRINSTSSQENFSGGVQWFSDTGRMGLRVDLARADYGLPGALTLEQFQADPRQASTLRDNGSYDSDRITAFIERRIGKFDLAAELSHREKIARSKYYSSFGNFFSEVHSRTTQFSPRLRHVTENASLKNELVAGFDFAEWQIGNVDGSGDAAQNSKALYLRDELQIAGNTRLALGVRHELADKSSRAKSYDQSQSLNAWDVQASHAVIPGVRLFVKAGQSYRLPNADDNGYVALSAGQILKPQTSHDLEFGSEWKRGDQQVRLTWFRHRLNNEIFLDPTLPRPDGGIGANTNLDPTQRQGVELAATARLSSDFTATANFQHMEATFTGGVNAGKEMVLVPKNNASARVNWLSGRQSANLGVQWVDSQRNGADFSNTCTRRMPSFTTIDGRYAVRVDAWEFALAGTNLTGKDYYSYAYSCTGGIYPETGRSVKFTARYDF